MNDEVKDAPRMSPHTPTPWRLHANPSAAKVMRDLQGVAQCTYPRDAAFIVQAVNSHEALVEALRHIALADCDLCDQRLCPTASNALALAEATP